MVAPLKRLGAIQTYAQQALGFTESFYKSARSYLPSAAEPLFSWVEDTATTYGAPYLTWAQDSSEKVLRTLDGKVDEAFAAAEGVADYTRSVHVKGVGQYTTAKDKAFGFWTAALDKAKTAVATNPIVEKTVAAGTAAKDGVVYWADPDKLVDLALAYYAKAIALPAVSFFVTTAEPVILRAGGLYAPAHDYLVAQPLYKQAWDLVFSTAGKVPELPVVKQVVDLGYPVVAPVVDPIGSNITKSKYLKQLTEHLAPAA